MDNIATLIFSVGVAGFAATYLLTPVAGWLARRVGAVDRPSTRKVHTSPTPRMGGVAIALVFFAVVLLTWWIDGIWGGRLLNQEGSRLLALLLCALPIVLLGVADDVRGVGALPKLIVQTAAATGTLWAGFSFSTVELPFVGGVSLGVVGSALLVFWIVGVTNAFNLLDGLDGLAAGVGGVAAMSMSVMALLLSQEDSAVAAAALAGCCFGFLRHNFHPARIFMGDSGSMFLGFVLAVVSIESSQKRTLALALALPILVLGIPVIDALVAIFRRTLLGRSPFSPDRGHLHHLLLRLGLSQRTIAVLFYAVTAILGVAAAALTFASRWVEGIVLVALLVAAAMSYRFFGYRLGPLLSRRVNWREEARKAQARMEATRDPQEAWRIFTELLLLMEIPRVVLVERSSGTRTIRRNVDSSKNVEGDEITLAIRHEGDVVGEFRIAGAPGRPRAQLLGAAQILDPLVDRFGPLMLGREITPVDHPPSRRGYFPAPSSEPRTEPDAKA